MSTAITSSDKMLLWKHHINRTLLGMMELSHRDVYISFLKWKFWQVQFRLNSRCDGVWTSAYILRVPTQWMCWCV